MLQVLDQQAFDFEVIEPLPPGAPGLPPGFGNDPGEPPLVPGFGTDP